MRTVIVHGIRQFRPEPAARAADHYATAWGSALSESPGFPWSADPIDVRAAYYADLLVDPGRQGGDELEPDAEALLAALLEPWMPDSAGAQGIGTWPIRMAIAGLAKRHRLSEKRTTWFLERFVSEAAAFLRTEGSFTPKAAVIDTVAEAVEGASVVIAHSLGSVVAYETLWSRDIEVPLLITVGSPLAIPRFIQPRLTPAPVNGMGAKPPKVGKWVNLADHGDIVAIPPGGVSKAFSGVADDVHGHIAPFDFHRIDNYLRCRRLGEILSEWRSP